MRRALAYFSSGHDHVYTHTAAAVRPEENSAKRSLVQNANGSVRACVCLPREQMNIDSAARTGPKREQLSPANKDGPKEKPLVGKLIGPRSAVVAHRSACSPFCEPSCCGYRGRGSFSLCVLCLCI